MATYAEEMKKIFSTARSRDIQAHTAKVHSVAWSCDGRRLASGSFDKTVCVYVLDKERLVRKSQNGGHSGNVLLSRVIASTPWRNEGNWKAMNAHSLGTPILVKFRFKTKSEVYDQEIWIQKSRNEVSKFIIEILIYVTEI